MQVCRALNDGKVAWRDSFVIGNNSGMSFLGKEGKHVSINLRSVAPLRKRGYRVQSRHFSSVVPENRKSKPVSMGCSGGDSAGFTQLSTWGTSSIC